MATSSPLPGAGLLGAGSLLSPEALHRRRGLAAGRVGEERLQGFGGEGRLAPAHAEHQVDRADGAPRLERDDRGLARVEDVHRGADLRVAVLEGLEPVLLAEEAAHALEALGPDEAHLLPHLVQADHLEGVRRGQQISLLISVGDLNLSTFKVFREPEKVEDLNGAAAKE